MALSRTTFGSRTLVQAIAVLLVLPAAALAQGIRLNGPFPRPGSGDVDGLQISPDGERAVYLATLHSASGSAHQELFSVRIDGSEAAVRLNATLPAGGSVTQFQLGADGSRVVYRADQDVDEVHELFSVPIDGSVLPVQISAPFVVGGDIPFNAADPSFALAADGVHAVYLADQEANDDFQLYSTKIDGSGPVIRLARPATRSAIFRISPAASRVVYLVPSGTSLALASVPVDHSLNPVVLTGPLFSTPESSSVRHSFAFRITPDGQRVVYMSEDTPAQIHLFSVPIDGSAASVNLGGSFPDVGDHAGYFELTPDGGRAAFLNGGELRSAPVDGSLASIRISAATAGSVAPGFQIAPDGLRIVYLVPRDPAPSALYLASVQGGVQPRKLSGPESAQGFRISPDGARVVFLASAHDPSAFGSELYSVALDQDFAVHGAAVGHARAIGDSPPVKLGENLNAFVPGFQISPDSRRVVFGSSPLLPFVRELSSVPIDGHLPAVKLDPALFPYGDAWSFEITPDGQQVVYRASRDTYQVIELFAVPITADASPIQLSAFPPGAVAGDVGGFELGPDGAHAIYWGTQDSAAVELYSVSTRGLRPPIKLNEPLPDGGSVQATPGGTSTHPITPHITPDGKRAVYAAPRGDGTFALFSVPLERDQPPVELSPGLSALDFRFLPAGDEIVFAASDTAAGLWRTPVDGSASPTLLAHLAAGESVDEYAVHPDGSRIVYRSAGALHSVLTDGSQVTVRLDPPHGSSAAVQEGFRISPQGSRVVFVFYRQGSFDLYSAPIDGSASAVKLSVAPAAFFLAYSFPSPLFEISADGSRVVFRASSVANAHIELFAARIDGSQAPLRLNHNLASNQSVESFRISLDGARVLYGAVHKLYSVPIDHATSPIQLNSTLTSSGSVLNYELLPDGSSVVYRAYDTALPYSLFRVPIDGSALAVRLNELSVPAESDFFPSAAGDWILYRSPRITFGDYELHAVRTDGTRRERTLNAPLVANGSVSTPEGYGPGSYRVSADGTVVLYQADQKTRGVTELFLSYLRHTARER